MLSGDAAAVLLAELPRIPLPLHLVEVLMLRPAHRLVGLALRLPLLPELEGQIHLDLHHILQSLLEVVLVDLHHLELFVVGQVI